MAKYSVAYDGAGGVPMAVPCNWRKLVSPKVKMLFSHDKLESFQEGGNWDRRIGILVGL